MLASLVSVALLVTGITPAITPREFMFGCDDRLALVKEVKALDHVYLAELAAYAASGQCTQSRCRPPVLARLEGMGNRKPVFERTTRDGARIKLSVCMDEGVMLVFSGVGTPHAIIVVATSEDDLRWDETPLWPASDANGGS